MKYLYSAMVSIFVCLGLFFYGISIDSFALQFTGLMLPLPMAATTSSIEDYFINRFAKGRVNE